VPDWAAVHHELKHKSVSLFLLWPAYQAATPGGLSYRWCCQTYRAWTSTLDLVMRQTHRAGEKRFVDDAAQSLPVVNRHSGEVHEAVMFVAVLGASSDTDAEATRTQSLPDWIGSHVRTVAALGGVPEIVVSDHLKAAVTRAHRDEPEINRTYTDLPPHDGFAVIPARAAKPRDQATVDVGGPVVERWMLARLRHHTFFALAEGNAALVPLLSTLHAHPFTKLPGSRQELFDTLERPALRPCLHSPMRLPSGSSPMFILMTTWRSTAMTTLCPTRWCASHWTSACVPPRWSASPRAHVSPATGALPTTVAIVRSPRLCLAHTNTMPHGRPSA
jgi:transposase